MQEAAMHARVVQFAIPPEKLQEFSASLEDAIPRMRERKGFQALLVLRVEGSNPPDVRVMTIWESQQALRDSENSLPFYQALSRALAFAKGFPVMREEEVVVHDFAMIAAANSKSVASH
jgi:heme-degrading monooxygenase HmoA